jgi:hypothetical protein
MRKAGRCDALAQFLPVVVVGQPGNHGDGASLAEPKKKPLQERFLLFRLGGTEGVIPTPQSLTGIRFPLIIKTNYPQMYPHKE